MESPPPPARPASAGAASTSRNRASRAGSADDFPIAVLGAGFAGIGAAIQLLRAGVRSFVIFERARDVGGTWRDNTYPGAACDVPSHLYCLSFEPSAEWSRTFAPWHEIQACLKGLVEKWGLRRHLRLDTSIEEARFDEERGRWKLSTSRGEAFYARAVIAGLGGLVDPSWPGFVDVRGDVQDRYNEGIQRRMRYMVWSSGCNSGYLSPDGSKHSLYPGFAFEYVLRARRFRPRDYVIARFDR